MIINPYGLYALKTEDVWFINRCIRYALLAMQNSDVSLLEDKQAISLDSIGRYVESVTHQDLKVLSIPFMSNEGETLRSTFKAAQKLTLVFDADLYSADIRRIKQLMPQLESAIQRRISCIPGQYVKTPVQSELNLFC